MVYPASGKMVDADCVFCTSYLPCTVVFGAEKICRIHCAESGKILVTIVQDQTLVKHIPRDDKRVGCRVERTVLLYENPVFIPVQKLLCPK